MYSSMLRKNTYSILIKFTDTSNHRCLYEIVVFFHAFLTDTMVGLGIKGEDQRLLEKRGDLHGLKTFVIPFYYLKTSKIVKLSI